MTMEEQSSGELAEEESLLQQAAEELTQVQPRLGPHFRRAEARTRAGRFLQGLLAPGDRRNGWQMAEELGGQGPTGVQRLWGGGGWGRRGGPGGRLGAA